MKKSTFTSISWFIRRDESLRQYPKAVDLTASAILAEDIFTSELSQ